MTVSKLASGSSVIMPPRQIRLPEPSQALRVMDQAIGDGVQLIQGYIFHAPEVGHPQLVFLGQVLTEVLGVDLDGAQSPQHAKAQEPPEGSPCERLG